VADVSCYKMNTPW